MPLLHAFVVRLWSAAAAPVLRGSVQHVNSGRHLYVKDPEEVISFIADCIETNPKRNDQSSASTAADEEFNMAPPKRNADIVRATEHSAVRRDMEKTLLNSSFIYTRQVDMMKEVYGQPSSKGGLDQQQRILIGLGMAVLTGPESAIEWTMTRAINHGVSEQMIKEAIDIALLNGGTFVVSRARFGYNALALRLAQPDPS